MFLILSFLELVKSFLESMELSKQQIWKFPDSFE